MTADVKDKAVVEVPPQLTSGLVEKMPPGSKELKVEPKEPKAEPKEPKAEPEEFEQASATGSLSEEEREDSTSVGTASHDGQGGESSNANAAAQQRKRNRRRPWTEAEDAILTQAMQGCASANKLVSQRRVAWLEVAKLVHGRTSKQCRDRWLSISPAVAKREWTKEEDDMLIELYDKYKNRWVKIAACFKGRNDNMIKSRFRALSRMGLIQRAPYGDSLKRSRASSSDFSQDSDKRVKHSVSNNTDSPSLENAEDVRPWTHTEDQLLVSLEKQLTGQWGVISKLLGGRSELAVKMRFLQLNGSTHQQPHQPSAQGLLLHKMQQQQNQMQQQQQNQMQRMLVQPQMHNTMQQHNFQAIPKVVGPAGSAVFHPQFSNFLLSRSMNLGNPHLPNIGMNSGYVLPSFLGFHPNGLFAGGQNNNKAVPNQMQIPQMHVPAQHSAKK